MTSDLDVLRLPVLMIHIRIVVLAAIPMMTITALVILVIRQQIIEIELITVTRIATATRIATVTRIDVRIDGRTAIATAFRIGVIGHPMVNVIVILIVIVIPIVIDTRTVVHHPPRNVIAIMMAFRIIGTPMIIEWIVIRTVARIRIAGL